MTQATKCSLSLCNKTQNHKIKSSKNPARHESNGMSMTFDCVKKRKLFSQNSFWGNPVKWNITTGKVIDITHIAQKKKFPVSVEFVYVESAFV